MLNTTGQAILSLCDGTATVQEIAATLAKRFQGISIQQMQTEISNYLNTLRARNLLVLIEPANPSQT